LFAGNKPFNPEGQMPSMPSSIYCEFGVKYHPCHVWKTLKSMDLFSVEAGRLRARPPVVSCWQRHDRISAISAITLAPMYERFGLYFKLYGRNITFDEVKDFLRQLHYSLRRKILLVLDNYSAHKKAGLRLSGFLGMLLRMYLSLEWLSVDLLVACVIGQIFFALSSNVLFGDMIAPLTMQKSIR